MLAVNVVDKKIGDRIQTRRTEIGLSCRTLAANLGVMTEQIELWEAGHARIPPSFLLDIAAKLATDASYFFKTATAEDIIDPIETKEKAAAKSGGLRAPTRQDLLLVQAFSKIKSQDLRESVVRLAERLAVQG